MPFADRTFYVTGGTLRHDALSYVERRADKALYDGLLLVNFRAVRPPEEREARGAAVPHPVPAPVDPGPPAGTPG